MQQKKWQNFIKIAIMKNDKVVEKIYDLLEMYDFVALSSEEKEFVLTLLSRQEYENMRLSIEDTRKFPMKETTANPSLFMKIANYRIEFYKVAAALLILLATGFVVSKVKNSPSQNLIALTDTVYIKQTDTVTIRVIDTIDRIIEKPQQVNTMEKQRMGIHMNSIPETTLYNSDCSTEICPEDLIKLSKLKGKNDFSRDKELTSFMVSLN
jgi:hypothetical protein